MNFIIRQNYLFNPIKPAATFALVDIIYNLPFDEQVEIHSLLAHNITASRRNEFTENYNLFKAEYASGKLEFSSDINQLKKRSL